MEKKEQYDAQVLGVLDGEIDTNMRYWSGRMLRFSYASTQDGDGPKDLPVAYIDMLFKLSASQRRTILFTEQKASKAVKELLANEKKLTKLYEAALASEAIRHKIKKGVHETLREGKLNTSVLIDSIGGVEHIISPFQNWLAEIGEREGSSLSTYVPNEASSLGANLWAMGQRRYVVQLSTVMFHTCLLSKSSEDDQEIRKADDRKAIMDLLDGAIEPYRSEAIRTVEEDIDGRHEIRFSGIRAEKMGLADRAFPYINDMRDHFNQETGNVWAKDRKTTRFWRKLIRKDMEDLLRRAFANRLPEVP